MADRRGRNAYRTVYINDNLARKPENYAQAAPVRREKPEQPVYTHEHKQPHVRTTTGAKNQGLNASFGFAFTVVMAAAMVVIFLTLVNFISLNIDISHKSKQIASLRKELSTVTMENDNMEMAINSSIDYDYIYKTATEELGMVYASQSQIVTYDHEDSEYVVQYKDVE